MKKFLIAFAVLIGLLLAAIIVLPVVFKDDIVSVVKEEANNAGNANIGIFLHRMGFYVRDYEV